jgi:hypothetical protein
VSRVFVVQQPLRFDTNKNELVPKFDLTPAMEHGEIVHLVGPRAAPWRPASALMEMRDKLADFDPENDSLLLTGNPCLIGWAVALAADMSDTGLVRLLQWSGKDGKYLVITSRVYQDGAEFG